MSDLSEFLPLVTKLLDRTRRHRIEWKETADSTAFICALEGKYSFEAKRLDNDGYQLRMTDSDGTEVLRLVTTVPDINTSVEEDNAHQALAALYEEARREALEVFRKVRDASKLLDELGIVTDVKDEDIPF